jgi:trigger factor
LPKFLYAEAEKEKLHVVGTPNVTDLHFHEGQPLTFKAEFEVMPDVQLNEYKGLPLVYQDPIVSDEDVTTRVEEIREGKAEQVNVDPRPLEDGDLAVMSLDSISGTAEPVHSDEVVIEIGGKDTLPGFSENLRGMSPGDEKEVEITYPEDYGQEKLAGRTVKFQVKVNGVRKKELPELNDEFAKDMGDFRSVDEFRDAVRKGLFSHRQQEAQQEAKNKLIDVLVDRHEFAVPETLVDNQIRSRVEQRLMALQQQGIDPRQLNLDWTKVKEAQHDQALREVRASLLLSKVAEQESIEVKQEEVDREVERIAREQREPVLVARQRLEKDGTLRRIASHIATEKTIQLLFENASKTAE